MSYPDTLEQVEKYVRSFFLHHSCPKYFYHNINHTINVVEYSREIACFYKQDPLTIFEIITAAWFHDTGYLQGGPHDHEIRSVQIMQSFFQGKHFPKNLIYKIEAGILATKARVTPLSFAGEILCDADTYHFGTFEFRKTDILMQKEIIQLSGSIPLDWANSTIVMLKNHHYYTQYCRDKLTTGKKQNIEWLESIR